MVLISCFRYYYKLPQLFSLHKEWNFPLRISSVNVIESAVSKCNKSLLQNASAVLLENATVLLENATVIT